MSSITGSLVPNLKDLKPDLFKRIRSRKLGQPSSLQMISK